MKTVVLLSGGIDSTVALALAVKDSGSDNVEALTFDYGQRHVREIDAAAQICDHYSIYHMICDIDPIVFGNSALTGQHRIPQSHAETPDATYVPARNTVMIALAAARAETVGASRIVIGANADDAAGYPDCRRRYIEAYRDVLIEGTINTVWLYAPLLDLNKKQIIQLGEELQAPLELAWSCYRGLSQPCGQCGACEVIKQ